MRNWFLSSRQRAERARNALFQAQAKQFAALDLQPNAGDVAGLILRRGMRTIVADILAGEGGGSEQSFLGFAIPNPLEPHEDDDLGIEFYYGEEPSEYMSAEQFMGYLEAINAIAPYNERATAEDMAKVPHALAAAGVL